LYDIKAAIFLHKNIPLVLYKHYKHASKEELECTAAQTRTTHSGRHHTQAHTPYGDHHASVKNYGNGVSL